MRPTWGRQDPGEPHIGPMNLAIWDYIHSRISMLLCIISQFYPYTSGLFINIYQKKHREVIPKPEVYSPQLKSNCLMHVITDDINCERSSLMIIKMKFKKYFIVKLSSKWWKIYHHEMLRIMNLHCNDFNIHIQAIWSQNLWANSSYLSHFYSCSVCWYACQTLADLC